MISLPTQAFTKQKRSVEKNAKHSLSTQVSKTSEEDKSSSSALRFARASAVEKGVLTSSLKQPKIIKKQGNKAVFEIEALYPGYGVTIGNSLRRVLLSSLSGVAVTQAKIKGVSHEFSTIHGVLEDVILIVLNLKQLRFKLFTDEPQKAFLKVKGEKEIKGSDFVFPSQVELVNKDCYLASLTDKSAELEIEIQIERGIGYFSWGARKSRKREKLEAGVIPVDAIFTPIKRVSYQVENMRVGERTDYDRLFLEIETDGIISPEQAFVQAAEILENHFSWIAQAERQRGEAREMKAELPEKKPKARISVKTKKPKKYEKKNKRTKAK